MVRTTVLLLLLVLPAGTAAAYELPFEVPQMLVDILRLDRALSEKPALGAPLDDTRAGIPPPDESLPGLSNAAGPRLPECGIWMFEDGELRRMPRELLEKGLGELPQGLCRFFQPEPKPRVFASTRWHDLVLRPAVDTYGPSMRPFSPELDRVRV